MRFTALVFVCLLLMTFPLAAVTIQRGSSTTIVDNPGTYDYAPAVMQESDGTVHVWYGSGVLANGSIYNDVIRHRVNGTSDEVVHCPTYGGAQNVQDQYPRCQTDYDPGTLSLAADCPTQTYANGTFYSTVVDWDWTLLLDPSVVKVNGQYYMYWDAPRTGGCGNGVNNQIFLSQSYDGAAWTKYPAGQFPQPVIPYNEPDGSPYSTTDRYGTGGPSVVYKDGVFHLYYVWAPWYSVSNTRLATSTDGIHFSSPTNLWPGPTSPGMDDVKYIPGWDLWILVATADNGSSIVYNVSRDGIHWLPPNWMPYNDPSRARKFTVQEGWAETVNLQGNEYGWFGDGLYNTPKATNLTYGTGQSNDPTTWYVVSTPLTLQTESAYGNFDYVDASNVAHGWAYDPDAGVNDAASNGSPSAPLGLDTWVRPVAVSVASGQYHYGNWQSSQERRDDLVNAAAAPDPYHGFSVDLAAQSFPADTYDVFIEAGEFPVGDGATRLPNTIRVTLP
jgi:hypothetical protein